MTRQRRLTSESLTETQSTPKFCSSSDGCIINKAPAFKARNRPLITWRSRWHLVSAQPMIPPCTTSGEINDGTDQNDAQSWYLLGRCYMAQQKYPKAYEAYQQAVYRDGRNPTFWCSIGVLYYQINQYRDALDAYSRAIRLNPNISEVWYDLGTLVRGTQITLGLCSTY